MLGKSFLAMRTEDILVSARFVSESLCEEAGIGVELVGIGEAGPPAMHAAALEPRLFSSLKLRACIASWAEVLHTPVTTNQLTNAVHGALEVYDLPDLLSTIEHVRLAD
jgi:hypothetical protein